jgi:hypothetical protein
MPASPNDLDIVAEPVEQRPQRLLVGFLGPDD